MHGQPHLQKAKALSSDEAKTNEQEKRAKFYRTPANPAPAKIHSSLAIVRLQYPIVWRHLSLQTSLRYTIRTSGQRSWAMDYIGQRRSSSSTEMVLVLPLPGTAPASPESSITSTPRTHIQIQTSWNLVPGPLGHFHHQSRWLGPFQNVAAPAHNTA